MAKVKAKKAANGQEVNLQPKAKARINPQKYRHPRKEPSLRSEGKKIKILNSLVSLAVGRLNY